MIIKASELINEKIFIIIFIGCILISCISLAIVNSGEIVFQDIDKKENIYIDTFIKDNEKYNIKIQYPITKNKKVNDEVLSVLMLYVNKIVRETKYFEPKGNEDKFNLEISTDIGRVNKDIVSFIFSVKYNYENLHSINIHTLNYNLKTSKKIVFQDFFDENSNYSNILIDKAVKDLQGKSIEQKILNYFVDDLNFIKLKSCDGYSFTNKQIYLYFNSNKISSKNHEIYQIAIPWTEVEHLLKKEVRIYKD